jgi:hypothetical protein
MDYRLQSIKDAALGAASRCDESAQRWRQDQSHYSDAASHLTEVRIARAQGKAEVFRWCADQMATFDIGKPGEDVDIPLNDLQGDIEAFDRHWAIAADYARTYGDGDTDVRRERGEAAKCAKRIIDKIRQ